MKDARLFHCARGHWEKECEGYSPIQEEILPLLFPRIQEKGFSHEFSVRDQGEGPAGRLERMGMARVPGKKIQE